MADLLLAVFTFIVGLAAGLAGGQAIGERLAGRSSRAFWLANLGVLLIGVLAGALAGVLRWSWLWGFSLALVGGGLTGLKYGYGRSVGVWRLFDRLMGLDPEHRR